MASSKDIRTTSRKTAKKKQSEQMDTQNVQSTCSALTFGSQLNLGLSQATDAQKPKSKRERALPDSTYARIIDVWYILFEKHKGHKPIVTYQTGKSCKSLIKALENNEQKAIDCIENAFKDKYFTQGSCEFYSIIRHINKYNKEIYRPVLLSQIETGADAQNEELVNADSIGVMLESLVKEKFK